MLVQRICLAAVLVAVPLMAQPLDPKLKERIGIDQKLDESLPLELEFTDSQGRVVRLGEYFGEKPVLITPVYYECPMLCTQVLNGLLKSLSYIPLEVGRDFEIVTFSIDPGETPELAALKKAEYVRSYGREGGEAGWHFLTGDAEAVARLTGALGFRYEYDEDSDQYIHASGLMVATPQGRLARYLYGIAYEPKDLRLGLVEAAERKIGTLADQVLLLCYQYDATKGKYSFAVMSALRVAGVLTVVLIGGCVVAMVRRERRRAG